MLTFTAGLSVAVAVSVPPVSVVIDPFCTLMSAAFVNCTTCHEMKWPTFNPFVRNVSCVALVSSPRTVSSVPQVMSAATDVFENRTKAWLMDVTDVIGTFTVVADCAVSPR